MNELHTPAKLSKLRANARGQLIGKYPVAILATTTVVLIESIVSSLADANTIYSTTSGYLTALVISLVIDLLMGIFHYGEAVFFLKIARGDENVRISDIFSGFKTVMDKSILVQSMFTGFSLLALIPSILVRFDIIFVPEEYSKLCEFGFIALSYLLTFLSYLYFGLSFYLLVDHNDWSALQIFKESLYLMKKKKGRYFMIYLTSIPLLLLGLIACGVGLFWFEAYFKTLLANFYLDAIGEDGFDLLTEKQDPPSSPDSSDDSSTLDIRL